MEVSFEKIISPIINADMQGKAKIMNNICEFKGLKRIPHTLEDYQKLNKKEYFKKSTGEVFDYHLSETRADNIVSLKRTLRKIRELINTNFTAAKNVKWVTLTYEENMTDTGKLYRDMEVYLKRLKRKYGNISYLTVIEPQERGAWHAHIIMRLNDYENIFIPNEDMFKLWEHGYTKTMKIKSVDNIGAYLTAYLTNVELTEETSHMIGEIITRQVPDDNGKLTEKKFIKGARLHMYPAGMNILRHSRDLKKPEEKEMTYGEFQEMTGCIEPDYSTKFVISDKETGKEINEIIYASCNTKRIKKVPEDKPDEAKRDNAAEQYIQSEEIQNNVAGPDDSIEEYCNGFKVVDGWFPWELSTAYKLGYDPDNLPGYEQLRLGDSS